MTNFSACGISVGPELDADALLAHLPADDKEGRILALGEAAHRAVTTEYVAMMAAIESRDRWGSDFSQPWA